MTFICLGENYMQHAENPTVGRRWTITANSPTRSISTKGPRVLGDGEAIDGHLDFVSKLDYEVELAVVLGRDALHVREEDVGDYIFGYSVANDVSARDVQYRHKQNFLGKSLDTFLPWGRSLSLRTNSLPARAIHQKLCQRRAAAEQRDGPVFFNIRHIVSELAGMTLPAGTILITGTPAGVGMGMDPPASQAWRCGHLRDRRIGRISTPSAAFCLKRFLSSLSRPRGFAIVLRAPFDSHSSAGVQLSPIRSRPGVFSRARLRPDAAVTCPLFASVSRSLAAVMPKPIPRTPPPYSVPQALCPPLAGGRRSGKHILRLGGQLGDAVAGGRCPALPGNPHRAEKAPSAAAGADRTAGLPQISAAVLFRWI